MCFAFSFPLRSPLFPSSLQSFPSRTSSFPGQHVLLFSFFGGLFFGFFFCNLTESARAPDSTHTHIHTRTHLPQSRPRRDFSLRLNFFNISADKVVQVTSVPPRVTSLLARGALARLPSREASNIFRCTQASPARRHTHSHTQTGPIENVNLNWVGGGGVTSHSRLLPSPSWRREGERGGGVVLEAQGRGVVYGGACAYAHAGCSFWSREKQTERRFAVIQPPADTCFCFFVFFYSSCPQKL